MKMMFVGKFDLDLFNDDINETKTKVLVRLIISFILYLLDWGRNQ